MATPTAVLLIPSVGLWGGAAAVACEEVVDIALSKREDGVGDIADGSGVVGDDETDVDVDVDIEDDTSSTPSIITASAPPTASPGLLAWFKVSFAPVKFIDQDSSIPPGGGLLNTLVSAAAPAMYTKTMDKNKKTMVWYYNKLPDFSWRIALQIEEEMRNKKGPKQEGKASYTYQSLHRNVAEAVSDEIPKTWFNSKDDKPSKIYTTHVMGKFKCKNGGCSNNGWGSKKVAIRIVGYPGNGYNATVYSQRCRSCNKFGAFTLDEDSYVERVAYRLKKWAGVDMEIQPYTRNEGPPHKRALCEGCRLGICTEGFEWDG
ncbi:zinc-binding domain-containing protein [Hypoxylon sp. FL1857]|nr:zinc-binding domain-containing protein [Hypoxylon sp. FL1857]